VQLSKKLARQQDTKNRICEAAFHLYYQNGVEGVSMRTIGNKLGVSQMMPYRYFKSKNHLITEMRGRVIDQFSKYLEISFSKNKNPESKLFHGIFSYLHYSEVASEDYRFAFLMDRKDITLLSPDIILHHTNGQKQSLNIIANEISKIISEPVSSKKVQFLTRFLWVSTHGLASANINYMLFGKPEYDDIKLQFVRQLFNNIIAPDLLKKLRKPSTYPEINSLVTLSDNFAI